jgi:hypothetical protein
MRQHGEQAVSPRLSGAQERLLTVDPLLSLLNSALRFAAYMYGSRGKTIFRRAPPSLISTMALNSSRVRPGYWAMRLND